MSYKLNKWNYNHKLNYLSKCINEYWVYIGARYLISDSVVPRLNNALKSTRNFDLGNLFKYIKEELATSFSFKLNGINL